MKHLTAVVVVILAALSMSAIAVAGTGSGNGQSGKQTGKTAAVYADAVFGNVICNETQHPKFDTVSCSMTNTSLAGTSGTVAWNSDFGTGLTGILTYTVSADGLSYTGTATY